MNTNVGDLRQVIIIGSGPAGLTAAIYAARANLKPLVIEGMEPGGQLTLTSEVENFPGFPEGIMGPELMENFKKQAQRFGADFVLGQVDRVQFQQSPLQVFVGEKSYSARSVIVASGASARWLGIESERKFRGKGVSTCATCDGAFYRNMDVAVVGGGDSAMEEAHFLTRFCKKVYLIHRRDSFRASKIMVDRARSNSKIEFILDSAVDEIQGDKAVERVVIENLKTKAKSTIDLQGVFVAIGHVPNTGIFKGQLEMHDNGYLKVQSESTATNVPGVFSAGDVHDFRYRQAITAAGSGCRAAMDAEKYLESLGH
jgi:thioredoxin reductase (NADPH)